MYKMQRGRSCQSKVSKKLVGGDQPPQKGWVYKEVMEVKVTASAKCPMVNVKVGKDERLSTWMIDSGAPESIMDSESFKERFPGESLQPLSPGMRFRTADGSPLNILGSFSTEFWFGKESVSAQVYVCTGITRTRLIGGNILAKFSHWGVDNVKKRFILGDLQLSLVETACTAPYTCEVQLVRDEKIPPRCSRLVAAELPHRYNPTEFVFKPSERMFGRHKLLVPICLVANDFFDETVLVRITNPTDVEISVNKGTKVGKLVNNVDEYELLSPGSDSESIHINVAQPTTGVEGEKKLREVNEELYTLYKDSTKLLKESERQEFLDILLSYSHVFSKHDNDLGCTNVIKHKIVPKSDKVVYRRQYRHTEEQHKVIDEEVQKLLDSGVIRESMSPFNSPVLMVPKKEKGKWRFCLDCRYINDLTEDQYFPIPLIDEAMDSLAGSSIYTIMDMTTGYHQVDLDEETSEMCAFSTRKGHFQYTRLPMGLRGSGSTFQKMVTLILSGMLHTEVLAYLDDCIL